MSAQADRLARKALELLKRYGEEASLTRHVVGTYNPAESAPSASTTSHSVQVLVQADSGQDGDALAKGAAVQVGLRKLLVAASGLAVVPAPGDEVGPLEGRTWRVLRTEPPVQLQGTPVLYVLRVAS
ncbi:hypothetical protein [Pyxidicoccus caerfyrddinensis]|uniref:hypothetical protein n=1 Tax=Pyxidicoccus caerfyrddinensis TaxID=2709663 RepID=UPI0013DB49BE|nr:hypothetical protein [Pyxidicoccus caerfyrddinensis]